MEEFRGVGALLVGMGLLAPLSSASISTIQGKSTQGFFFLSAYIVLTLVISIVEVEVNSTSIFLSK